MAGPGVSPAPVWAQALPHREAATTHSILSSQRAPGTWDFRGGEHGRSRPCPGLRKSRCARLEDGQERQLLSGTVWGHCLVRASVPEGVALWWWPESQKARVPVFVCKPSGQFLLQPLPGVPIRKGLPASPLAVVWFLWANSSCQGLSRMTGLDGSTPVAGVYVLGASCALTGPLGTPSSP